MNRSNSELNEVFDFRTFEKAFSEFLNQADRNAESKKGEGGETPYGFAKKPNCDGAYVCTHYGQGRASKTPYLNWWVVSIYYITDSGNIVLGMEEDRYPHLKEMELTPLRYEKIGNKKMDVAIFYSTTRASIDYLELHKAFIEVSEEVMRLGLR